MSYEKNLDYIAAGNVTISALRSYLVANNWIQADSEREDVNFYCRPEEDEFEGAIFVPKDPDDRPRQFVLDAARKLAKYERRNVLDILDSLQKFSFDRVRCRLISPSVADGIIPLGSVVDFVEKISRLLSTAVKDVVQPELVHQKISSAEITELLNNAQFGQTERGSFIVNIFVPIERDKDSDRFKEVQDHTFRRSLEHLMTSLDLATRCIDDGSPERFLEENSDNKTITSVNLLEYADNARIGDDSDLEISVNWSSKLEVSDNVPNQIRVKKEHSPFFWRWVSTYRPQSKKISEKEEFVAKIIELKVEDSDSENRPSGTVVLRVVNEDEIFDAKVYLQSSDFHVALDCVSKSRCVVFRGRCERLRNKAEITQVSDFRAVVSSES